MCLRLGSWKGCALPGPFSWMDGPCKILGVWFDPDLQKQKKWSEVLEKGVTSADLWLLRKFSLKGWIEVCSSLVLYRLWLLIFPCIVLFNLERVLYQFIWAKRTPLVLREICQLHLSVSGRTKRCAATLCVCFLGQMFNKTTRRMTSGRKVQGKPYRRWEACTREMGRPIICSEANAPSIRNVDMLLKFSLGCRPVSLINSCCRVRHCIEL